MLVRKRINAVSDRRKAERQAYDRARQMAWNRDKGQCQAAGVWTDVECAGRVDPHHLRRVSQNPELRCDPNNIRCICRKHHDAIHANPLRALALGLLKN